MENPFMKKSTYKTLAGLGVLGGVGYHVAPNTTAAVASNVSSLVGNIMSGVGTFGNTVASGTESLVSTIPHVGAYAPFAAPIIAGGYLGYKLGDMVAHDNAFVKGLLSITGAGTGQLFAGTAYGGMLVGGATIYGGYKLAKGAWGKLR